MRAKLKEIKEEMRQRRHHSIPEQGHWLKQVVTGFFAYHAVPTNIWSLGTFRFRIIDLWRRSLRRRSQKDGTVAVEDFDIPARVPDQPCLLYGMGLYRNGISSHSKHVGEKFLGQAECVASNQVLGLQEPAAQPTTD